MHIGWVSDEMHIALADVQLEFTLGDAAVECRSSASGAVRADLAPGRWRCVLTKDGYGRKTVEVEVTPGMTPHRFRLLADRLLGYAWPKWAQAGDPVELRIHAPEPYR